MPDTDKLTLKIDYRLDAYKSFFNHAWAKEIIELAEGTKLESVAFMLTVNLRGAANCHTLPWLMINSMSGVCDGFMKGRCLQGDFIGALATELPKRMEGKITRMKQREMGQIIRELADKINAEVAKQAEADQSMSPETIWKSYLDSEMYEWIAAIWGSQRLVFSGLFFGYESFVKDVIAIAEGNPGYTGFPFSKLLADTKKHFGDDVAEKCLEGDFLKITQFARHALAHNCGKETTKLKGLGDHGLDVVDGLLQIQCPDNITLCRAIEKRSLLLVGTAAEMHQFKSP